MPLAPDADSNIRLAASIIPGVKGTILNWSKVQKLNATEQLKCGIRYFDCRIGLHNHKAFRFLHGLWGPQLIDELHAIVAFLEAHPSEVIILDFNHFYDITDEDHVMLTQLILSIVGHLLIRLGDYSANGPVNWDDLTLEKLNQKGKQQILLFYANDTGIALSDLAFWPHSLIKAPWPRCKDHVQMMEFHETHLQNRTNVPCNTDEGFYVWQGIVTPDASMIMGNLTANFYEHLAKTITPEFTQWIGRKVGNYSKDCNAKHRFCNIFIADAVELDSYIKNVISLNY